MFPQKVLGSPGVSVTTKSVPYIIESILRLSKWEVSRLLVKIFT